MAAGRRLFHTIIVHAEDDLPVQLEDRYVNPAAAPAYLDQDFVRATPNQYLMEVAPLSAGEHLVEAALAQDWECRHLRIEPGEPCLLVRRRTWSDGRLVSSARLLYPGTRYTPGRPVRQPLEQSRSRLPSNAGLVVLLSLAGAPVETAGTPRRERFLEG